MKWYKQLLQLGMIRPVSSGIQVDINAAVSQNADGSLTHATLCDHNCLAQDGYYTCPAAVSLNPGVAPASLATANNILSGIELALQAMLVARERFLADEFGAYCDAFQVPKEVSFCLAAAIGDQPVEINITGGNPELHPEIDTILARINRFDGVVTNLTTTGRRFMVGSAFREKFMLNPPDILSLSVDSFGSAAQIFELTDKSPEELLCLWQAIPKECGQRQKALEAIYVASQLKHQTKPHTGFNLVVHAGNIDQAEDVIRALSDSFPGFHVFPYPVQTAYLQEPGVLTDVAILEKFIDRMISAHFERPLPITRRLHYWLMLKAVIVTLGDDAEAVANMVGGKGLWQCFRVPGTIRYLQLGKGGGASPGSRSGGGYLGCFWNSETITCDEEQIWNMGVAEVADFIYKDACNLAGKRVSPCQGCGFPRLLFDVVSTEMGLNEKLVPAYLELRKHYAGY